MELCVHARNHEARECYRKCGFEEVHLDDGIATCQRTIG